MSNEIWKDVPGYENIYSISNYGVVKNKKTGKILKQSDNSNGYKKVTLCRNTVHKQTYIHRVVAQAFLGESKLVVNHKNGIKHDNRVCNLEWVTYSQNNKHAYQTGLKLTPDLSGEKNPAVKYCKHKVILARILKKEGYSIGTISRTIKISRSQTSRIIHYKSWKHV